MSLRDASPGALAGALAGVICGDLDVLLVLRATGAYWIGYLDVLETQAVWGTAGMLAGALAGVVLASVAPRTAVGRGFGFRTVSALGLFAGLTGLGWFHLYDVGLPLGSRDRPLPYAACALLAAAIAVAAWLFQRRFFDRGRLSPARWRLGALGVCLLLPFVVRQGAALAEPGPPARVAGDRDPPPSVVLLVMDTTRRDGLSVYGNPRRTTPNLDRIAAEGLVFKRAYSVAPWTPPAHATLFTGVHPSRHGTYEHQLRLLPELPTLAETFRDRGYRTFFIGAKYLLTRADGWTRGFDEAVVVDIEDRVATAHRRVLDRLAEGDDSETPVLIDLARGLLERTAEQPFFLFLNVNDPHTPYVPREPYFTTYARDVDRSQVDWQRVRQVVASEHGLVKVIQGKIRLNPEEMKLIRAIYDSETAYMDAQLGRFFDFLRELSRSRPILLLITADHGEMLGEHGLMAHGQYLYEELIHVPLILWGRPAAPGVDDRVVSHVDVFPTLIAAAGIDPATYPHLAGGDLFAGGPRPPAVAECWARDLDSREVAAGRPIKAIVAGSSKLIWDLQTSDSQLFDLATDDRELRDRAPEDGTEVRELQELLASRVDVDAVGETGPDDEAIRKLKALGYL